MVSRRLDSALLAASLVTAPAAAALGAPAEMDEALVETARDLELRGEALFKKKEYARARASFLAAWALKQHWTTAGNLADCELKLGLYRDAAEHFALFLRGLEQEKRPVPDKAMERYREAVSHVGVIEVRVTPPGAEVLVDGKLAGTVPFATPVFVEPGMHTIEARLGGNTSSIPLELKAGERRQVYLDVSPRPAAEGDAAGAAPAEAVKEPGTTRVQGGLASSYDASGSLAGAVEAPPAPVSPVAADDGGHPKAVFVAGGAIAGAAAVGTGVALALLSSGRASDADELLAELKADGVHCSRPPQPGGCAELLSLREERDLLANTAMATLIGGGVIWAATAAYTFWPRPAVSNVATTVRVMPVVAPEGGGLWVSGTF